MHKRHRDIINLLSFEFRNEYQLNVTDIKKKSRVSDLDKPYSYVLGKIKCTVETMDESFVIRKINSTTLLPLPSSTFPPILRGSINFLSVFLVKSRYLIYSDDVRRTFS